MDGADRQSDRRVALTRICTALYSLTMSRIRRRGAEQARNQLPELLDDAEKGQPTIITRHRKPIAVIIPFEDYLPKKQRQQSILPLAGTGRGLWGEDSRRTIRELKDEWER